MRRLFAAAAVAAAAIALAAGPAAAAGKSGSSPGQNKDALIAGYAYLGTGSPTPSGTVTNLGQAISGGFYGNTSNAGIDSDAPASGHGVTAPASPGPAVGGCASQPGSSVGDAITGNPSGPSGNPNGVHC